MNKGYTLIELVVVAGILGVIGVVSVGLFMSTMLGGGKSAAINEVRSNGDFAITQMERVIRSARQIVGTCDAGMNSLSIINPDGSSTEFASTAEDGYITQNSEVITSDDVVLNGLINFDCIQNTSKSPETVAIEFTLQKGDESSPTRDFAQINFSTTVQLRNF